VLSTITCKFAPYRCALNVDERVFSISQAAASSAVLPFPSGSAIK
jgi:hypothetical protein